MAITNNGCKVSIPDRQIPSGYTKPTVTTFSDVQYERTLSLSVDKTTVHNATAATTLDNILDNGTIGINKQIDDILAADYLGTATVVAYADLIALENNYKNTDAGDAWLTNAAAVYTATVKLYVKAN